MRATVELLVTGGLDTASFAFLPCAALVELEFGDTPYTPFGSISCHGWTILGDLFGYLSGDL
jgi:hypothetical protein